MYANKTVRLEDNLYMFVDSGTLNFFSTSPVKLETVMYHIYNRPIFRQFITDVVLNNTDITQLFHNVLEQTVVYENDKKRLILFPLPGLENRYTVLRSFTDSGVTAFPYTGEILSAEELEERKYVRK